MAAPPALRHLSWLPYSCGGSHPFWQRITYLCPNQGVPHVMCDSQALSTLGKLVPLTLASTAGSAHPGGCSCPSTRAGCQEQHLSVLVRNFPSLSSEMIIPLTRKVMTLIHYFKCHLCKVINQLNVRLDYILILIVLNSCCFLNKFSCSFTFQQGSISLSRLYLAVISPLWKYDRQ